ncbi:MAG: hypothetical protein ACRDO4_06830 [Nocardioides sp.]
MPRSPAWLTPGTVLLDDRCPLPLDRPFTRQQAAALGVGPKLLRRAAELSLVREVVRGAYAVAQLRDTIELRAGALSLVVSDGAVVTDRTAAWLHDIDVLPRRAVHEPVPVDVFSAGSSRLRRPGVNSGIRSLRDDEVVEIGGVALTSMTRTALDLGRMMTRYDAIGALDAFLRAGVPRHELEWGVHRFKGYRGVIQLRELVIFADPRAESMPESALRLHGFDGGLPLLVPQVWVEDVRRVDLGVPELRYAAEYLGERFHGEDDQREDDAGRREWLEDRWWVVDDFWKDDLYGPHAHPAATMRTGIARAREQLGAWRPQGRFLS